MTLEVSLFQKCVSPEATHQIFAQNFLTSTMCGAVARISLPSFFAQKRQKCTGAGAQECLLNFAKLGGAPC